MDDLAQEAIQKALSGDWLKASEINLQILKSNPQDSDALNRLARAYTELGQIAKAKETSLKVLKTDSHNNIALKALEKYKRLGKHFPLSSSSTSAQVFLEEPGKTKTVNLICLGDPDVISQLDSGDEVKLISHQHRVCVVTQQDKYLGRLPDDLSARLRSLIRLGNEYQVFITSVNPHEVKAFIRETFRSPKFAGSVSFPTEKIDYVAFTPPELVFKKEEVRTEEADEEEA